MLAGKVKLGRRSSDGRENLVAVMGPSDQFGELSLFDPGPRTATATVVTDARLARLPKAALHEVGHRSARRSRCSCCGWWPAGCAAPTRCSPT